MSFAHIIADLRATADRICTQAAEDRETAARHENTAETCRRIATLRDELARTYTLLADALGTGRITRDQLREIVNVEMLNDEPNKYWADRQWWNGETRTKDEDGDAEHEKLHRNEPRGFDVDDVVNVSAVESSWWGSCGIVTAVWNDGSSNPGGDRSVTVRFGPESVLTLPASWLMHNDAFVAQMDAAAQQPAKEPEPADDEPSTLYTQAQLDGDNCALCGHFLAEGQATGEYGEHDGEPLLAHLLCIADDETEKFEREGDVIDAADRAQDPERFGWADPAVRAAVRQTIAGGAL